MSQPRNMDTSYSGTGQFIHNQGFWAIGGLTLTTRRVGKNWRIGLHGTKTGRQDITGGHEDILQVVTDHTGIECVVARVRGPEDNPLPIQAFEPGGDWVNITPEEYVSRYLNRHATRKP